MKGVLSSLTIAVMQSEKDAERLRELGMRADRVFNVGNLKFEAGIGDQKPDVKTRFGLQADRPLILAARSGSVDATSLSPEFGQVVVSENYRVLVDLGKENVQFQSSGLVVPRSLIKTNPQMVENIARATVEGTAFIHKPANKEIVMRSLARNLRLDRGDRVEKAYQQLTAALPRRPCPSTEGIVAMLKLMAQHGLNPKASQMKPEEVADMSYCKRFEDSGFFKSLY